MPFISDTAMQKVATKLQSFETREEKRSIRPVPGIVPLAGARVDARARCLNHQRVELNFGQRSWRRREKAPFPALKSPPSTV